MRRLDHPKGTPKERAARLAIGLTAACVLLTLVTWSVSSEAAQAQDRTPVVAVTPAVQDGTPNQKQSSEASADLERTGTDAWYMAAGGGLFVLVGVLFVLIGRRQKPDQ